MAELIGGSGYDDVQATAPTSPSIGDTWLDTSDGDATGKIYADLGNGADWQILPVQDELQSGRTRELLMSLQDGEVPKIQDPMDVSDSLGVESFNGDYEISTDYDLDINYPGSSGFGPYNNNGFAFTPYINCDSLTIRLASGQPTDITNIEVRDTNGNTIATADLDMSAGDSTTFNATFSEGTKYVVEGDEVSAGQVSLDDEKRSTAIAEFEPKSGGGYNNDEYWYWDKAELTPTSPVNNQVTDKISVNTPLFKQWDTIQAQDVTTGSSTSPEPVEFEILDSSDTVLNSTRIPKARIADDPFTMRNRVYSESAGSDGQSDYQIATTGDGGHFGIPILTVVSVKKNGSVLDSANWSFDGTDTATIDTSNVTIASGDTIDIKYDFDVFDSALQPRAYLSRESTSETSPSISHFKYEYVI